MASSHSSSIFTLELPPPHLEISGKPLSSPRFLQLESKAPKTNLEDERCSFDFLPRITWDLCVIDPSASFFANTSEFVSVTTSASDARRELLSCCLRRCWGSPGRFSALGVKFMHKSLFLVFSRCGWLNVRFCLTVPGRFVPGEFDNPSREKSFLFLRIHTNVGIIKLESTARSKVFCGPHIHSFIHPTTRAHNNVVRCCLPVAGCGVAVFLFSLRCMLHPSATCITTGLPFLP